MITKLISTALGVGYSPIAPGTAGSLFALIIFYFAPEINPLTFIIIIVFLFLIGTYTAAAVEQKFIKQLGNEKGHDPQIVVIDEVVGMLIALVAIPKTIYFLIAAFILFRLFDITKPFPINYSQKIPGGLGIMIDDVIAGIFANILIQIFILFN